MLNTFLVLSILLVICAIIVFVFFVLIQTLRDSLKYEDFKSSVKVIGKYHSPSYTSVSYVGMWKSSAPISRYHPEEFNVKVQWNDFWIDTINSKAIFDSVKVDDIILLRVHVGRDKNGEIKKVYITEN